MTDHVVVAGGGLAGLVAARSLAAAGPDVTLFERESTVGGRVRSRTVDGYVCDRGFQVLFPTYPAVERELDLQALDLRSFRPGATLCRPGQRSTLSDPLRDPGAFTDSLFNREVTLRDKLLTLKLRRDLRGRSEADIFSGPDESIRSYLRSYGFSERFVENFAAPFYGGITLDRSLETSARVFQFTFQQLSRGRAAIPAGGMGAITEQLRNRAETAGVTVETDREVTDVDADGTATVGGETVDADATVVATDPPTAHALTGVDSIPTDAEGCVTLWCSLDTERDIPGNRRDPLGTDRRILLNAADGEPNSVVSHTALSRDLAPEGRSLLSVTFLGDRAADDEALLARTREALDSWYRRRGFDDLDLVAVDRIPNAQFAQPPGIHETLPAVDAPAGDVYLAGEYTEWSSIQGAMESGRAAAEAVLSD